MNRDMTSIAIHRERLKLSFWLFMAVLAYGAAGYWLIVPESSLVDCLYMTVISVTTVGYGEVIDLSHLPEARVFTISLIFAGMGIILYFVSNITAFLIDGSLKEIFAKKRMEIMVGKMKNHYIVCGVGASGMHVVEELVATCRQTVVIDLNTANLNVIRDKFPSVGVLVGDASENDVLTQAGLLRAAGIIVATDNDKDNLVITLSARQLCPQVRIVARCKEIKHADNLRAAGANAVISTNYIGGLRMVSEMVRPSVVSFLDTMLRDRQKNYRIEDVTVDASSPLVGRNLTEIRRRLFLLAVAPPEGDYILNPPDAHTIEAGSKLIIMGTPEDRVCLESLVRDGG